MVMVCLLDVRGDVCCEWAILCVSLYFVLVCQSVKERGCVCVYVYMCVCAVCVCDVRLDTCV